MDATKAGDECTIIYTPDEIVKQIILTLTYTVLAGGKLFQKNALDVWSAQLLVEVTKQVRKSCWEDDQSKVLTVAQAMGKIAVILAHDSPAISELQVMAAFKATNHHGVCQTAREIGLGCWCDCA